MKRTFTRGKFAKINGVTLFALRLYDRVGILKPAFTDENGYHLYTDDQSQQLLFIDICIKSGFSLKEIKALQCEIRSPDEMLSLLRRIRERIHQKQVEYSSCEHMIDSMIYYHETSSRREPGRPFLKDNIHFQGFVSDQANFLLNMNAERSHEFISRTEDRLEHPIEFPLSYLIDPRAPDFSHMRLIIRTRETFSDENFYDSGPCRLHCITAFHSDVAQLQGKVLDFIRTLSESCDLMGEVLLTPVQDYLFHGEEEQSVYVAGVPVQPKEVQTRFPV